MSSNRCEAVRVKNNIIHKTWQVIAPNSNYLASLKGDYRPPTDRDFTATLQFLQDFQIIGDVKEGDSVNKYIPSFKSKNELYTWRIRQVHEYFNMKN